MFCLCYLITKYMHLSYIEALLQWSEKISRLLLMFSVQFPLPSVVLYATHQENKRLFGFVLRTSGGRSESNLSSVCYIFESNNEGEKVRGFSKCVSIVKYVSKFLLRFLDKTPKLCLVQLSCFTKVYCFEESWADGLGYLTPQTCVFLAIESWCNLLASLTCLGNAKYSHNQPFPNISSLE